MSTMIALRRQPHPALSGFVEDLWLYDGYVSAHDRERILPSGTFELVLNLQENELRIYGAEKSECRRYSGAVISGPYTSYFGSDAAEEVSLMGVHFRPGGAFPFLGFPAGELLDAHIDLAEVWKADSENLRAQLAGAASAMDRFRILERELIAHLERPLQHHPAVLTALDAHTRLAPQLSTRTRDLARAVDLSERRFIDLFRAEVGVTPKVFDRIRRFHRTLRSLSTRKTDDWADLAVANGYYDQSHLIRDFGQFTGLSPTDYVSRLQLLQAQGAHTKPNHLAVAE